MDPNILLAIIGGAALAVGLGLGKILFARNTQKKMEEAEIKAETILKEAELRAETVKKEKEVEAKERFVQLKAAHEREILDKNKKLNETENRIRQKEQSISQKEGNLDKQVKDNDAIKENLNRQIEVVNQRRAELDKKQEEHVRRLEKIANLSAEEARNQLVESLKQEAETRALVIQQRSLRKPSKKPAKKRARSLFRPFNELPPSKPLKIPSPFSTWKAMRSKDRSLGARDETSVPLKQPPGLT